MPPLAVALVLVAAVLHAGWNILLKTSVDPLRTAVRLQAIGTAVLVSVGILAWVLTGRPSFEPAGVGLALVSGVLETAYFIFLSAAYGRGDLSLVYPLARGSAPLGAVLVGVGLLHERLALPAGIGVACLLAGILLVARPWRALRAAGAEHRGAIGFALATGATIAAYSAIDRLAVRMVVPWAYGAILAVFATSMEVGVLVLTEEPLTGEQRLCCEAYLTFVALGPDQHPRPVPPLLVESELERQRQREASTRRAARLELREALRRK